MFKSFRLTKKFWILMSTVAVIATTFTYYFLVYIPQREKMFTENKYRVLNRMAQNVLIKKVNYEKIAKINATNLARHLFLMPMVMEWSEIDSLTAKQLRLKKPNVNQTQGLRGNSYLANLSKVEAINLEKRNKFLAERTKVENQYKPPFENIRYVYDTARYQGIFPAVRQLNYLNQITFHADVSKDFFSGIDLQPLTLSNIKLDHNMGNPYSVFYSSLPKTLDSIKFSIGIDKFLTPIIKRDFDEFFLISSCSDKNKSTAGSRQIQSILFQTFQNELRIQNLDSVFQNDRGIVSSKIMDLTINNAQYKLFYNRIAFDPVQNIDWILCGLVKADEFKKEVRQVDALVILYASLMLLIMLTGMPILKLLAMSPIERLRIDNVWFCGFSLLVGSSLLFLNILATRHYWGYNFSELDSRLTALSNTVHNNFITEANQIYQQLIDLPGMDTARTSLTLDDEVHVKQLSKTDSLFKFYNSFNEVIWIDKNGDQKLSLATHSISPWDVPVNLSEREYFRHANGGKLWTLPVTESDKSDRSFYMQSIHSYYDANDEVGFSIPLGPEQNAKVLVMATKLKSVMNTMLLPGYGFTIFDPRGEVLLSSQMDKNLQENIIDETDNDNIRTAVYGRLASSFSMTYSDHRERAFIRPINNLPLFLMVHYDLGYYKTPIILTINHALILLFLMFGVIGFQQIMHYLCLYKVTKLRSREFYLRWLRPRKDPAFIGKYLTITLSLTLILALLFIMLALNSNAASTFCVVILPVYLSIYVYIVHEEIPGATNLASIPTFIVALFNNAYFLCSFLFILLLNTIAYRFVPELPVAVLMQIFLCVLLISGKFLANHNRIKSIWSGFDQKIRYRVFIFLWFMIVSFVPVVYFYKSAFHVEYRNWVKFIQLEAISNLQAYEDEVQKGIVFEPGNMINGNYLFSTKELRSGPLTPDDGEEAVHSELTDLVLSIKPSIDSLVLLSEVPSYGQALDRLWNWHQGEINEVEAVKLNRGNSGNGIASLVPQYRFFTGYYSLIFWITTIVILYMLYRIIAYSLRNIYGIGLLEDLRRIQCPADLNKLIKGSDTNNIFLVGAPYSGKETLLNEVRKKLTEDNKQTQVYNFYEHLYGKMPRSHDREFVFIEHFEFGINDHLANETKLALLQQIVANSKTRIVISSTVQPGWLFDYYDKMIGHFQENKDAKEYEYRRALRLWKNVMSGFSVVYQPILEDLTYQPTSVPTEGCAELRWGNFLPGLSANFDSPDISTRSKHELFVIRVEELADSYYQSIWNSLSWEEKILLHDLAKDQLVNLKNSKIMNVLLQKGLLVVRDSLEIMNRSFANFIVAVVKEDEEKAMDDELRSKGSWNTLQVVLILTIASILVFISLAQQDFLHDLNTLIGTISAVIAALLKFGGLFSTGAKLKD